MVELQIVMGSLSDYAQVKESGMEEILNYVIDRQSYGISVCSAHRNPDELKKFVDQTIAETSIYMGIAGMAAALPGALASNSGMCRLVIGVPLDEHGVDSCLYMPPGVPVATAGVGKTGLKQAALIACQVLAINNPNRLSELQAYLVTVKKSAQFDIQPGEL
ncbi:MAG TPA: AIR carboxylase family protein [Candidatus Binatia bacterium]|nr:AIR carboxylase family protein [Candidatus Binatia bacterium]